MLRDCRGLPTSTTNAEANAAFDRTMESFLRFGRDTADHLQTTLAADPGMVLANCLKGYFFHLRGLGPLVPRADQALAAAQSNITLPNERERKHVAALAAWCRGDVLAAADCWDSILVDYPLDILAIKLATYVRFYQGGGPAFRDAVARPLYAWDEKVPGYGYVLGTYAFALEENADYVAAEKAGRRAVEIEPRDGWATHAVAHVLEMQERRQEGIDWINSLEPHWSAANNFRYHLWWHRALAHLALDDSKTVIDLYDRTLWDPTSDEYLDLCNDVALLVRLELAGIDVGKRWRPLAEKIRGRTSEHILVFVDCHFLIGLAAGGLGEEARAMLDSLRTYALSGKGTNAEVTARVGLPLCEGLVAHRDGAYGRAVDLLLPIRYDVYRIGGSHAQRDLVAMILIDAAIKAGRQTLARALLAERTAFRPKDPWTWRSFATVLRQLGDVSEAARAEAHVHSLSMN
jgi:tetratricopeptide (TPR) repeat protein